MLMAFLIVKDFNDLLLMGMTALIQEMDDGGVQI